MELLMDFFLWALDLTSLRGGIFFFQREHLIGFGHLQTGLVFSPGFPGEDFPFQSESKSSVIISNHVSMIFYLYFHHFYHFGTILYNISPYFAYVYHMLPLFWLCLPFVAIVLPSSRWCPIVSEVGL